MDKLVERYSQLPMPQRLGMAAVIGVLLVVGYWYFYYADHATKVEQLSKRIRTLQQERDEKQAYVDNLAKYEARLAELQVSLDAARAQLPDDQDVPQLLAQLGNRGREVGLTINQFTPKGETTNGFFAEIPFDVTVKGSFHEITAFIDSLSRLDRIVNVGSITMVNPRTQSAHIVVDGGFTIKSYRFIDKPAGAK